MPINPNKEGQGGDVEGETPIDVSQGEAIRVSKASFDPGYPKEFIDNTLSDAGTKINRADLMQGYCTYGRAIGDPDENYAA